MKEKTNLKKSATTITLTPKTLKAAREAAKKEGRSLSNYIEQILNKLLDIKEA